MKRALFMYNPLSGDRSVPKRLDYVIERLQNNGILAQPFRIGYDGYKPIKRHFNAKNFDFVVVSGGDGTLNTAVNYMMKNKIKLPFAMIPSGTCNDFARSLNIGTDLDECINIILRDKIIDVDVGLVNDDTYFLSTFAGGLFVGISFNTNSELKKNLGAFAYYMMGLNEVKNIKPFKIKIKIMDEGEEKVIEEEIFLFLVLNGKNAAGFSDIIAEADIRDGYMDVVLVKKSGPIELASLFFKVIHNEISSENNIRLIRAKECIIESNAALNVSIDGEKGIALPVKIKFMNKALSVFTNT